MNIPTEIKAMEDEMSRLGITAKALCEEAYINQSTWTRWKSGLNLPNFGTWARVTSAFETVVKRTTPAKPNEAA